MQKILKPYWIILVNILPMLFMFLIMFWNYEIIKSLLKDENLIYWRNYTLIFGGLTLVNIGYVVYLFLKQKRVHAIYGVLVLLSYIPLIYLCLEDFYHLIPFSIPDWLITDNLEFSFFGFFMPAIAYSVLVLVAYTTTNAKENKAWVNFVIAVSIPVCCYLLYMILLPQLLKGLHINSHVYTVSIITFTLLFLFFLLRAIYILVVKKAEVWRKYQLLWKIPGAILLPLAALLLNNGGPDFILSGNMGVLGNFGSIWFYILTLLNGVFICLSNLNHKVYRILLFLGRAILFPFVFYFFIVVLPLLPFALILIIVFGLGFLLLTPIFLLFLSIRELIDDYKFLKNEIPLNFLRAIVIIGLLVLPFSITFQYYQDKQNLTAALNYVYTPDYSSEYRVNEKALKNTLEVVALNKEGRSDFIETSGKPYLSAYYNWLVLDNLTISDAKLQTLEKVFFGASEIRLRQENIRNDDVVLTEIKGNSVYNEAEGYYTSTVDLELTNESTDFWGKEYTTTIELPEGAWISDYYLYVGDTKEPGILTEKRTAMWVFSNIRNENRDPGILYYLSGNKVAFRVFPFGSEEVRKTGLELIHKEPITLTIDGQNLKLGDSSRVVSEGARTLNNDVSYVSSEQKLLLPKEKHNPYIHFLVDMSVSGNREHNIAKIKKFLNAHPELKETAKISYVSNEVTTKLIDDNWVNDMRSQPKKGGYFLERAIKRELYERYLSGAPDYPLFVSVTDDFQNAIVPNDFSDWQFALPEINSFYELDTNGLLLEHSLVASPFATVDSVLVEPMPKTVRAYRFNNKKVYLPNDNVSSIVLNPDSKGFVANELLPKHWNSGLKLHGQWRYQVLHPESMNDNWVAMLKGSFSSKIMTPLTSYLVVENESQKAMLKRKYEQVLKGNYNFDLDDDSQRMSEPELIIIIPLLLLFFGYHYLQSRRKEKFNQ